MRKELLMVNVLQQIFMLKEKTRKTQMMIKGDKYKIENKDGIFYTATIQREDDNLIYFTDRDGKEVALAKSEIKRYEKLD